MTAAPTDSTRRVGATRAVLETALFFLTLGLLWEAAVRVFDVRAYLLPTPSDVARAAWDARILLMSHGLVTLEEVIWGFLSAAVLGVATAVTIFFVPVARRTLYPLVVGLQSVPKIALAPMLVVWLGYGLTSKVAMAFLFAFFPIVIATLGGFEGTPTHLEEHFRALRASAWVTFTKLRMPAALPSFVDGCKVAMPLAVIGAIVGEFVGSNEGLGNLILLATGSSRPALTFAALGAVTALSVALFFVIEACGRLVWWRSQ